MIVAYAVAATGWRLMIQGWRRPDAPTLTAEEALVMGLQRLW